MLVTMQTILAKANEENYAVAAPNVSNELNARAAIEAAENMNAPLILDVAFRAADDIYFLGSELVRLAKEAKVPVAINLDHGRSLEEVVACIRAGFTSVMIDRSSYAYEENIKDTSEVVKIAHSVGVSVEAELGHVGRATSYEIDRNAALTDPNVALEFINRTGVDCLAVAIGTAHGAYPKGVKPQLDLELLKKIKEVTRFPLVMHGSSGTDVEDLRMACRSGINKVNINNDLCQAVVKAVKEAELEGNDAYGVFVTIKDAFRTKLEEMIEIYGSKDKA